MPTNRILNIALIGLATLTAILSFFTVRELFFAKTTNISSPALHNVYLPDKSSSSTFRYYNGNTFVQYDSEQDIIEPLTALASLYDVNMAYWYRGGVVFSANSISETSDLAKPFEAFTRNLNSLGSVAGAEAYPTELVFWNLSFKDNKLTPLGPFTENELNTTATTDGGLLFDYIDSFTKINPDGTIQSPYTPLFGKEDMQLMRATENSVFYIAQTDDRVSLERYDIKNEKTTIVLENIYKETGHTIEEPVYMLDDTSVYLLEESGISGGIGLSDVIRKDIQKGSTHRILGDVQGFFDRISAEELVFIHLGQSVIEISHLSATGRVKTSNLTSTTNLIIKSFTSGNDLVYVESNGQLYGLTDKNGRLKAGTKEALETGYKSPNSALTRNLFNRNNNSYTLTVAHGSVKAELENVFSYIRSKQLNPYEFTIMTTRGASATD